MKIFFKEKSIWIVSLLLLIASVVFFIVTPPFVNYEKDEAATQIYFADNISVAHQKLIERFNNAYAGQIEVVPVNLPFTKFSTNERKELLARTLRSKSNRIDIFSVDIIWVPRFAKWCEPLNNHFSQHDQDQILDQILPSCFYQDTLFAMPLYYDMGLMYYRKDLIDRLPDSKILKQDIGSSISWENFRQLHQRFPGQDNPFYYFAADSYEGLMCSFIEMLASQGQPLVSDGQVQLLNPKALRATRLLIDLVNKYQMTPSVVTGLDEFECYLEMFTNDGVFLRGWPGLLRHYRDVLPDTSKFKLIKKAPLPHFSDGEPAYIFGGWNLMISKFSDNKKEAIEFIRFVLKEQNQKMIFQVGGYLPVTEAVYKDDEFVTQEPDLIFYQQILPHGVHRPYLENYTKISDIITYYLNRAIRQQLSPEQALQVASRLIKSNHVLIK